MDGYRGSDDKPSPSTVLSRRQLPTALGFQIQKRARFGIAMPGSQHSHAVQAAIASRAFDRFFASTHRHLFIAGPPGVGPQKQDGLFNLRMSQLVGAFLLVRLRPRSCRASRRCARVTRGPSPRAWTPLPLAGLLAVGISNERSRRPDDRHSRRLCSAILRPLRHKHRQSYFLGWLMGLLDPPDRARTRSLPFILFTSSAPVAWITIHNADQRTWLNTNTHSTSYVYTNCTSHSSSCSTATTMNQTLQFKRLRRWRELPLRRALGFMAQPRHKASARLRVFANMLVL